MNLFFTTRSSTSGGLPTSLFELRRDKSLEITEVTERSFSIVESRLRRDDWTKILSHCVAIKLVTHCVELVICTKQVPARADSFWFTGISRQTKK